MKDSIISIRLTTEEKRRLERLAEIRRVSLSSLVRQLLLNPFSMVTATTSTTTAHIPSTTWVYTTNSGGV